MKVLNKSDRIKIRALIRENFNKKTHAQTAELLNQAGFRRPDGRPCDRGFVGAQCWSMRLRRYRKKSKKIIGRTPTEATTPIQAQVTTTKFDPIRSVPEILKSNLPKEIKRELIDLYL